MLRYGLGEWGGPARCAEELAVAMRFSSISDLFAESDRIVVALEDSLPMRHIDWEIVTTIPDFATVTTIRGLQRHLVVSPLIGKAFGTRYKQSWRCRT